MNSANQPTLVWVIFASRLAARARRAENERAAYSAALHEVVDCHQRLLLIAHLAKTNGGTIDPQRLIACLTGQDAPHARAAG